MVDHEIDYKTLAAQVQERIREAIFHRVLPPGERIDQNKLADDLNVSLVPVREALKSLEAEGLVTIIPRRGAFVTEISSRHLDDLYVARQIIEGEVAFWAVPRLQESDFARLDRLIQQMKTATDTHDIRSFMKFNREFHITIYTACGNQHLLETVMRLWERSELYRYRYMFVRHNATNVHQEHVAILEACRARDAERVKELARQHIKNTQEGLHEELKAEIEGQY